MKGAAKWAWKHKADITLTTAAFVPGVGSVAVVARVASVAYRVRKVTVATKSGVYVASNRNRVESFIYYLLGTKRAPWLANKIRPPRARIR